MHKLYKLHCVHTYYSEIERESELCTQTHMEAYSWHSVHLYNVTCIGV